MVLKGVRVSGAHGMPEGAELVLGSLELEVDATLDPQLFRSRPLSATTPARAQLCVLSTVDRRRLMSVVGIVAE